MMPGNYPGSVDYPGSSNESGIVSVLVEVTPQGRASSCTVTEMSGSERLDKAACNVFMYRTRFEPARNAAGMAVAGIHRATVTYLIPPKQNTPSKEVSLQVSKLPADYRQPVKITLVIDATGHVESCNPTMSSGSVAADRAACTFLRTMTLKPPRSASPDVPGKALRYITAALIAGDAPTAVSAPPGPR